jgi:hypothetical protein
VLLEGIVVSLVLGTSGDEFTLELVVVEIFWVGFAERIGLFAVFNFFSWLYSWYSSSESRLCEVVLSLLEELSRFWEKDNCKSSRICLMETLQILQTSQRRFETICYHLSSRSEKTNRCLKETERLEDTQLWSTRLEELKAINHRCI